MTRKAFFLCGAALLAGPAAASTVPGGAPRLEDFRIDEKGTVTRPADPAPVPPPAPTPAPAPAPAPTPSTASPAEITRAPAPRTAPRPAPAPAPVAIAPAPEIAAPDATAAEPVSSAPSAAEPIVLPETTPLPAPETRTPTDRVAEPVSAPAGDPIWPWLLVPLALAGIGVAAWRVRRRPAPVSTSIDLGTGTETPDLAEPVPLAEAVPLAAAAPAPPVARPQIELALEPQGATLNEGELEVRFTLHIRNTGEVAAENIRLASKLMSGGREVEDGLRSFYADPLEKAVRLPQTAPPGSVGAIRGRVRLKTDEMKILTVQDRALLVPLIAVNLRYGWAGGEGQTAQSFVLGRELDPPAPRMAPLPISQPPRVYKGLGTRPHALALVA